MSAEALSSPAFVAADTAIRYPSALLELLDLQFGSLAGRYGTVVCNGSPYLAELFLRRRETLTLVEHDERVRAHIQSRITAFGQAPASFADGQPEATGLASASQDFIAADRILFSPHAAAIGREFARILRPGAPVILITDNRVYTGDRQAEEYERILRSHCPGFREKSLANIPGAVKAFFRSASVYEDAFIGQQVLTFEELMAQTRALPIFPGCEGKLQANLENDLARFFKRWAFEDAITIPTVCRVAYGSIGS